MTEYDNTNRGVLFNNDRKTNEKDPDYSGTVNIGGKDYWLNGWIKTSAAGKKYLSLSAKEKTPKPAPAKPKPIFNKQVGF